MGFRNMGELDMYTEYTILKWNLLRCIIPDGGKLCVELKKILISPIYKACEKIRYLKCDYLSFYLSAATWRKIF